LDCDPLTARAHRPARCDRKRRNLQNLRSTPVAKLAETMTLFAEHAFSICSAKAKAVNRRLNKAEWLDAVQEAFNSFSTPVTPKPISTPKNRTPKAVDTDWLTELEQNPAYAGIDVKRELGKAQAWAGVRGEGVSRRRFINWLNNAKAERPIAFNGQGATSFAPKPQIAPNEPLGWQEWVRANSIEPSNADKPWGALEETARKYIISQLLNQV